MDSDYAYNGGGGVRPLCVLKSDILVSFNEDEARTRATAISVEITNAVIEGLKRGLLGVDNEEPEEAPRRRAAGRHGSARQHRRSKRALCPLRRPETGRLHRGAGVGACFRKRKVTEGPRDRAAATRRRPPYII